MGVQNSGCRSVKPESILVTVLVAVLVVGSALAGYGAEVRAFWVDAWGAGFLQQSQVTSMLGTVGDEGSIGEIRDVNCNTVVVQTRRRADVCYPSLMGEPYMSGLSPSDFNALQACIDSAHDTAGGKSRVDVLAWFTTFLTSSGTVYQAHDDPGDPDNYWVTLNNEGVDHVASDDYALDPGHPKALEYLTNVALDMAFNYDVDGIHFDYLRFLGNTWGYNPTSISRFNARYNRSGQPDYGDDDFEQWRRDQITALVRRVYAKAIYAKPNLKVTAATVTWTPAAASSTRAAFQGTRPYYQVFQDWDAWMQEGILDEVFPMDYYDQGGAYAADYTKWMNFTKDRKANRHAVIGPGIYLNSLDNAILQLLMTRYQSTAGKYAQGFCGYSYRVPYVGGSWSGFKARLKSDVTPTYDSIPTMTWKSSPTKGHIMGTVIHYSDGAWADGATVTVSGGESRTMTCDGTGFYAFIDLTPGTYTVTASESGYSDISASVAVTAGNMIQRNFALGSTDVTNPSTPTNLTATAVAPGQVNLSWTASTDNTSVTGYNIYRNYFKIGSSAGTSHSDTTCTANTHYSYRVAAYDASKNESPMSSASEVTTPTAIKVTVDEESASFTGSWTYSTVTDGAENNDYKWASTAPSETATAIWRPNVPATGLYDVYCKYKMGSNRSTMAPYTVYWNGGSQTVAVNQQNNGGSWVKLVDDKPFTAGTSGYVKLGNGTGESSKVVIADAIQLIYVGPVGAPPATPADGTPTVNSTTSITWRWNDVSDETGYRVKDTAGTNKSGDLAANTISWTESTLTANTQYTRRIYAFNGSGESGGSTGQTKYTLAEAGESTDGTGNTGNVYCASASKNTWYAGSKTFVFSNPAGFGTGGTWKASKFEYKWNKTASETWSTSGTTWTSGTISLTASSGDGDYYLHVRAFNGDNTANNTDVLDYGPFRSDATPPSDITVTDEGACTPSLTTLKASWTASSDSGSGILRYEYAVGTTPSTQDVKNWASNALSTSVTIGGLSLVEGTSYYIQARAKDNAGNFSAADVTDGILAAVGVSPISYAWAKSDGDPFSLRDKVVTAALPGAFWLEETDRTMGIKVVSSASVAKWNTVSVAGALGMSGTQRALIGDVVVNSGGSTTITPLGVIQNVLGGGNFNASTPGVTPTVIHEMTIGAGLYNVGLLVKVWGNVTYLNTDDPSDKYFFLDDGGRLSRDGHAGALVRCGSVTPPSSGMWVVTGIVATEQSGSRVVPVILIRDSADIVEP